MIDIDDLLLLRRSGGGGTDTNLATSDLTQTDQDRVYTVGTDGALTFVSDWEFGALTDTIASFVRQTDVSVDYGDGNPIDNSARIDAFGNRFTSNALNVDELIPNGVAQLTGLIKSDAYGVNFSSQLYDINTGEDTNTDVSINPYNIILAANTSFGGYANNQLIVDPNGTYTDKTIIAAPATKPEELVTLAQLMAITGARLSHLSVRRGAGTSLVLNGYMQFFGQQFMAPANQTDIALLTNNTIHFTKPDVYDIRIMGKYTQTTGSTTTFNISLYASLDGVNFQLVSGTTRSIELLENNTSVDSPIMGTIYPDEFGGGNELFVRVYSNAVVGGATYDLALEVHQML